VWKWIKWFWVYCIEFTKVRYAKSTPHKKHDNISNEIYYWLIVSFTSIGVIVQQSTEFFWTWLMVTNIGPEYLSRDKQRFATVLQPRVLHWVWLLVRKTPSRKNDDIDKATIKTNLIKQDYKVSNFWISSFKIYFCWL